MTLQFTLPVGGSDHSWDDFRSAAKDFNPRSPWGERRWRSAKTLALVRFQSTLPVGGATWVHPKGRFYVVFQSTLPVGGATGLRYFHHQGGYHFNPRSPWGERHRRDEQAAYHRYFNPRSPWGERLWGIQAAQQPPQFQSTLPVGGATPLFSGIADYFRFQSTLPVGGATQRQPDPADREKHFNPRSPWGERPYYDGVPVASSRFQSTLPVGGATGQSQPPEVVAEISIHAPRGGSDGTLSGETRV